MNREEALIEARKSRLGSSHTRAFGIPHRKTEEDDQDPGGADLQESLTIARGLLRRRRRAGEVFFIGGK